LEDNEDGGGGGTAVRFKQTTFSFSSMHVFPAIQLRTVPPVLHCITCPDRQLRTEHIL